jgi:hypothetical protein
VLQAWGTLSQDTIPAVGPREFESATGLARLESGGWTGSGFQRMRSHAHIPIPILLLRSKQFAPRLAREDRNSCHVRALRPLGTERSCGSGGVADAYISIYKVSLAGHDKRLPPRQRLSRR